MVDILWIKVKCQLTLESVKPRETGTWYNGFIVKSIHTWSKEKGRCILKCSAFWFLNYYSMLTAHRAGSPPRTKYSYAAHYPVLISRHQYKVSQFPVDSDAQTDSKAELSALSELSKHCVSSRPTHVHDVAPHLIVTIGSFSVSSNSNNNNLVQYISLV